MKKNLLFAGLLLASAAVFAQPNFTKDDPYQIFLQDFESENFEAWSQEILDSITDVQYYKKPWTGSTVNNVKIWEDTTGQYTFGPIRHLSGLTGPDSVIYLRNDIMTADDPNDQKIFENDTYGLSSHETADLDDLERNFATTPGKKSFFYNAGDTAVAVDENSSTWKSGLAARYRRNLFVRNIPIEENSSYRFTAYVKTQKLGSTTPTFYADVMRGYFSSEKPFSMGLEDASSEYKYKNTFEYTKDDFVDNQWEKITFMTYYLNDSIADNFVFVNGYWWTDYWKWTPDPQQGEDTVTYQFIQQPDKFFVRVGFSSDSTLFNIDNISLTKSWIGGCEYRDYILRVDFGYETNLKALCAAQKKITNIGAVELPGDYFTVWGKVSEGNETEESLAHDGWENVPIRSAEYHEDGYMYMFTDLVDGSEDDYYSFSDFYDSVYVSFVNPDDEALRLNYNGSLFPNALDTAWIKAGKKVMNFTNEFATKNMNLPKVFSMKDLPPVYQGGVTAEDGSFQLDPKTTQMTFQFSKKVYIEAGAEKTNKASALMYVYKAGQKSKAECWSPVSSDAETFQITFQRPASAKTDLEGDYIFEIVQVKGVPETEYSEDQVLIDYSFGTLPDYSYLVSFVNFESQEEPETTASTTISWPGFSGEKCAVMVAEYSGLFTRGLQFGYLSQKTGVGSSPSSTNCAKLFYSFDIEDAGSYDFEIGFANVSGTGYCVVASVIDANDSVLFTSERVVAKNKYSAGKNVSAIDTLMFNVSGMAKGSYKLALSLPDTQAESTFYIWTNPTSYGHVLYYLGIVKSGNNVPANLSFGYGYQNNFNIATKNLKAAISTADARPNDYQGETYNATKDTLAAYSSFNKAKIETAPSVWNNAIKTLGKAEAAIKARFTVVDNMWTAYNNACGVLKTYQGKVETDSIEYTGLDTYIAMAADTLKFKDFACSNFTDDSIKAVQKIFEADQTAFSNHVNSVNTYLTALANVEELLTAADAQKSYDEYITLNSFYNDNKTYDYIAGTKVLTDSMTTAFNENSYGYLGHINYDGAVTARTQALAKLASSLKIDFGNNAAELASRLEVKIDDDNLAAIYMNAIKKDINTKLATSANSVKDLDMTGFVKNFNLYTTAAAATDGSTSILHRKHEHNDTRVYILSEVGKDYTDVFPGWTVSVQDGGNKMLSPTSDDNYTEYKRGYIEKFGAFDGSIFMDWSDKGVLSTELEGLPAGYYSIGINFYDKAPKSGSTLEAKTKVGEVADSTFSVSVSALGLQTLDSVRCEDGKMSFTMTLVSGGQTMHADNVYLKFIGALEDYANYGADATAAGAELQGLLDFVDAAEIETAPATYYNINGVKSNGIKSGLNIKVTEKDGKRSAVKVFVK